MTYELSVLFAAGFLYLLILFLIAYATDRGKLPRHWVRHPAVYTLSLGVYATSWSYYGSVGFAKQQGLQFLTIYLGVTLAFLLAPVLLRPILRLTREYQLTSLADLFAFRYRSQLAGILVTLFTLVGTLPYIALQIRAVTESLRVLTQEATPQALALGFCGVLVLFAILFGARHVSPREKHEGLVVAIAFESLVKLIALTLVGLFALFGVFGGPSGLDRWLAEHPEAVEALYQPAAEGPWFSLLFLAFAAAFLLPRQFHMGFTESLEPRSLGTASWAFPLFLLLLNLPIPIVLWAGTHLQLSLDPDYYVLGITLGKAPSWLPVVTFLGGVSAASAMVIVTSLALAAMCLNHLLLPASYPDPRVDLYRWLLWGRRVLIAMIILAGYGFYELLEHQQGLVQLGLISFVAVAQFVPGIVGVLYWKRATRGGFISGLAVGIVVWYLTLMMPLLEASNIAHTGLDISDLQQRTGLDHWAFATFWSVAANSLLFVIGSLLTRQRDTERDAAQACASEARSPLLGIVAASSSRQFTQGLAATLGREIAEREVQRALRDLDMSAAESRPSELRRLREQIERNLSGLIGPQLAHIIVARGLRLDSGAKTALADSMRYLEARLAQSRSQLQGLSADLDRQRRYLREILLELPLGVCSVSADKSVVIWNLAIEVMTGIHSRDAVGRPLKELPRPWGDLLAGFAQASDEHIHRLEVEWDSKSHWFNLHKAYVPDPDPVHGESSDSGSGIVMLLEDLTDLQNLEAELAHSDRLASVGRLAAGVAHEIGNPVTAIASLAQNLREESKPRQVREGVREILRQTKRIAGTLRALTSFSHSGSPRHDSRPLVLREIVEDAARLVRLTHRGKQVECTNHCPEHLRVQGDAQGLSQVLVNLFTNACDASQPGDRIEVLGLADGDWAQIEVLDQGQGIPHALRESIFDPFFTTKAPGEGTGLGLSVAYQIVQDHGGNLHIDSEPGVGTRAVVRLPIAGK